MHTTPLRGAVQVKLWESLIPWPIEWGVLPGERKKNQAICIVEPKYFSLFYVFYVVLKVLEFRPCVPHFAKVVLSCITLNDCTDAILVTCTAVLAVAVVHSLL